MTQNQIATCFFFKDKRYIEAQEIGWYCDTLGLNCAMIYPNSSDTMEIYMQIWAYKVESRDKPWVVFHVPEEGNHFQLLVHDCVQKSKMVRVLLTYNDVKKIYKHIMKESFEHHLASIVDALKLAPSFLCALAI